MPAAPELQPAGSRAQRGAGQAGPLRRASQAATPAPVGPHSAPPQPPALAPSPPAPHLHGQLLPGGLVPHHPHRGVVALPQEVQRRVPPPLEGLPRLHRVVAACRPGCRHPPRANTQYMTGEGAVQRGTTPSGLGPANALQWQVGRSATRGAPAAWPHQAAGTHTRHPVPALHAGHGTACQPPPLANPPTTAANRRAHPGACPPPALPPQLPAAAPPHQR